MYCEAKKGEDNLLSRIFLRAIRKNKKYNLKVKEIVLGRKFTYVMTEESLGIAFNPLLEPPDSSLILEDKTIEDLVCLVWSHPTLSSISLAAINAASSLWLDDNKDKVLWNADITKLIPSGNIAVVGYLEKEVKKLIDKGSNVTVYEFNRDHLRDAMKEGIKVKYGYQLPIDVNKYDAFVVTGASLVYPEILPILKNNSYKVMIGPTSSFFPCIADELNINVLGGSKIVDIEKVSRLIKAGFGFKALTRYVQKWTWLGKSVISDWDH